LTQKRGLHNIALKGITMAPKHYVVDIGKYVNENVVLKGWVYNARSSGKLVFIELRDGTGIIQCVLFKGNVSEELFNEVKSLPQESSLIIHGKVREDKRSPIGFEVDVANAEIVHKAAEYPISPKEHGVAFLMDHRHLWLRSKRQFAILRIRDEIIRAIRDFFDERGFICFDAPIFTPNACEGTSTLFQTNYFDQKAYLTQSGQLYGEAGAMAFGKVYCFGPTFRAEKSKTRRHLTEFWMIEPEMAYYDLNDDMDLAEEFIEYIVQRVVEKKRPELAIIERDISKLENIKRPFPRISYEEAIAILQKNNMPAKFGDDFGGDEETIIAQNFNKPLIIHRFPAKIKAFYMKNDPHNKELVLGMDMLAPEGYGEIIGGAQREDDYEILKQKILEHGLSLENFNWYLDLRKYGSVPHAGFGLGLERTVAWICGLHHVRETNPFPRLMDRLSP